METKEKSNWDTYDFQDWVVRNVSIILTGKQLDLFIKNNFGYNDLKFFGKIEEAEKTKKVCIRTACLIKQLPHIVVI